MASITTATSNWMTLKPILDAELKHPASPIKKASKTAAAPAGVSR